MSEFVNVKVFGHLFRNLDEEEADILITLEIDGIILSKKIIDEKIHNYKIRLTPDEIKQYVAAYVAQQEYWQGMDKFNEKEKAFDLITDKVIADRVRNYTFTTDGKKIDIRGCTYSFMPADLEKTLCTINPRQILIN